MIKILRQVDKNKTSNNNEWSFSMDLYGTESCIRFVDVDEDGLDDLIFGLAGIAESTRLAVLITQIKRLMDLSCLSEAKMEMFCGELRPNRKYLN